MSVPPFFSSTRFVLMMALLSGLTALAIDMVLPTFPNLIEAFNIPEAEHNRIQQVVFMYMLGLALMQIVFGVLADVWGRKRLLLVGLFIYTLSSILTILAPHFEWFLAARFLQGAGLAASRVMSMTIIRDISSGRQMAKTMSFVIMVFLIVPVLAPMIGQIVLLFAPWQTVFGLFIISGLVTITWVSYELPETLHVDQRIPLSFKSVTQAISECLRNKTTLLYMAVISMVFATLMIYISQAAQILQEDVYHLGNQFPFYFALVVTGMVVASYINGKVVMKLGMQKIVFAALTLMLIVDTLMFVAILLGKGSIPLWAFITLLIFHYFAFGLSMPNLNAMVMAPYRHIAGTASSLIAMITTVLGVVLAQIVGNFYNGDLMPLGVSYFVYAVLLWVSYLYLRSTGNSEEE
jgi:MFS transporter, DHA1 family, multidrug resistance protein